VGLATVAGETPAHDAHAATAQAAASHAKPRHLAIMLTR
jgi:hypothetical protein